MRDLTEWRASAAMARFHLLTALRAANGPFWVTLAVTALALVRAPIAVPESELVAWEPVVIVYESAQTVSIVCILHFLFIIGATSLITSPRRDVQGREVADLMETAPISPLGRFIGDMLGATGSALVVHLCTLPVVALAFVLSPVSSTMFWWYEAVVISMVILVAAGVSWKKRMPGAWGRARAAGQTALTLLLALLIIAATTRRGYFGEAVADFLSEPSERRWSSVMSEIMSPPLFVALFALLYFGSILYFAARSISILRRAKEGLT